MKKLLSLLLVLTVISCGSEQKRTTLPGSFKYLSYYWNNSKDSVGLSLNYYIDIAKDGNYSLILRKQPDSTGYYYGFVGNELLELLGKFVNDTTIYNQYYLPQDTASKLLRFRYDYRDSMGPQNITFAPTGAPPAFYPLQKQLDSLVNAPHQKKSQVFNVDLYLKKLIAQDSGALSTPVLKN